MVPLASNRLWCRLLRLPSARLHFPSQRAAASHREIDKAVGAAAARKEIQEAVRSELSQLGLDVITTPGVVKAKSRDHYWFSPVLRTALQDAVADCVVAPRTEEEVLEVLKACRQHQLPVIPRGAGTGNYGQAVPLDGGMVLDLSRLVGFEEVQPGVVRAAAGQKMGEIEARMRSRGYELRMFPSTVSTATVGGFVAGGSTGVGGLLHGTLTEPGNVLALRLATAQEEPKILELRSQADLLAATHAYGTNGVITSVELALAPATAWEDVVLAFPSLEAAVRGGFALAEAPGIPLRSLCLLQGSILRLKGFAQLAADAPEAAASEAALLATVARPHVETACSMAAEYQGAVSLAPPHRHKRPLYEYGWNHTTLRALQVDSAFTYQQVAYRFEPDLVQNILHVHDLFAASGEMLTHLEWVRLGGRMGVFGIPLQRYQSEARLHAVIAEIESSQCAYVMNPHTYVLEDGGMRQTNHSQLEFKKLNDPLGLLNPGKMRAYEDRQPTSSTGIGYLHEMLREGRATSASEAMQDLSQEMRETLAKESDVPDVTMPTPAGVPGAMRWGGRARSWADLTHEDMAALPDRAVAVLPVGAIEQHGLHLPVGVDSFILHGILEEGLQRLSDTVAGDVIVMPLQAVGTSNEHLAFPGTLTLPPQAFVDLVCELGKSVQRAGIRKLLVVNSHGGQVDTCNVAARRLRVENELFCCVLHTFRTWDLDGHWPADEVAYGIHGGGVETSMMMHLQGDLVRREKMACNTSSALMQRQQSEERLGRVPLLHPHSPGVMCGWMAHDLHKDGAVGDALDADPERGRRVVEGAGAKLAQLLEELVEAEV